MAVVSDCDPAGVKPPFAYFGGKTRLARRIAGLFPPHAHYVEPFAGSLAVLLAKPPAAYETVNDLDQDLMTWWRVLLDRPEELIRACALTPHSRAEYAAAAGPAADELERARRVWTRLAQGRSGAHLHSGWRYRIQPSGSSSSMPAYLASYVERMVVITERLARVSLECRPALEIIQTYGGNPEVLLMTRRCTSGCIAAGTCCAFPPPPAPASSGSRCCGATGH